MLITNNVYICIRNDMKVFWLTEIKFNLSAGNEGDLNTILHYTFPLMLSSEIAGPFIISFILSLLHRGHYYKTCLTDYRYKLKCD